MLNFVLNRLHCLFVNFTIFFFFSRQLRSQWHVFHIISIWKKKKKNPNQIQRKQNEFTDVDVCTLYIAALFTLNRITEWFYLW